ncbi:MAG: GTPase domain-containing protein [Enhygromyxa sp.]
MALFDPERKRVVIRVVYDGPGHAGKTTNLQRLAASFAAWRRSDLVSPGTIGERTQYFDWLEVDGGLLRSYPIRAQLLTVPGQRELALRRRFVIERADVVVFVADSQPGGVEEAQSFYAELCEQLASLPSPVPIVFQANKQDLPGALKPATLAAAVCEGLPRPKQVVRSVASNNDGVKQTLAVALRIGSEAVRQLWAGVDPAKRSAAPRGPALPETMVGEVGEVGDPDSTLAALEHHEAERSRGRKATSVPTLPAASQASTRVWPPQSGRALLEQLEGKPVRRVPTPDRPERYVLELRQSGDSPPWRLLTGTDRFFDDEASALAAMELLASRKVALGAWLPEPCAIACAVDSSGGGAWLWTVDPVLWTLAEELEQRDEDRRRDALACYAEVIVGAEALAETHELLVELDPGVFGLQSGDRVRTRYLGERLEAGRDLDSIGPILATAERFAADESALAEYVEILCLGFHYAPQSAERRATLRERLAEAEPRSPGAARLCKALRMVLRQAAH